MTEVNHRRGTRSLHGCRYGTHRERNNLPAHQGKEWQRIWHKVRRAEVRRLIDLENYDDIPENTPKHILWDYW